MTDSQKNDNGGDGQNQPDPASAPANDQGDPEKGFWERLDKAVEAAADRVVEKRLKGLQGKADTGTSRGAGRSSNLPEIIADFMFGKKAE